MLPWDQRPVEVAHLFNPAYCSLVLYNAVSNYQASARRGMDYAMALVVLPVLLHKATRELLPLNTATKMHVWMQRHHEARIGFTERMQNMVPISKEAILFALHHEVLKLNTEGALEVGARQFAELPFPKLSEAAMCVKKAGFIGRWFAEAGSTGTFLAAWGVKIQ